MNKVEFILTDDIHNNNYGGFPTVASARNFAYNNRNEHQPLDKLMAFSIGHYTEDGYVQDYKTEANSTKRKK